MTDPETLAYDRGLKDGIEAAHQVQDLVLGGLGYNAVQALDIVIGRRARDGDRVRHVFPALQIGSL